MAQKTLDNAINNAIAGSASIPSTLDPQTVTQSAGGFDPQRFDWAETWYPVHYVDDLDRSNPTPFTLLDQDLVIWWESISQTWRVMVDQCPHRFARLSEGRISEAGQLECPYHGWTFSGSGQCEQIPQLPDGLTQALNSPRACVKSFPTAVRQGLLFVYPGKAENADHTPIPIIEPMEETPEAWVCINLVRDLPYDALTLMENVLDASHVPYTHHKTVGNRANAAPVELEVLESGKQGFTGTWAEGPRRGQLGRQDTRFIAPNLMWHDLTSKQFGRTLTVVYAVPIRKGECRLFARFPFKFGSPWPGRLIRLTPRWYSHIGQNAILEDDQIFLHHQERYLESAQLNSSDHSAADSTQTSLAQLFYLPTKADAFVLQFHKWISDYQANSFPGQVLPPSLSKPQLLDRYHSHTIHCASCRGALARIKKLRWICAIASALFWTLVPVIFVFSPITPAGLSIGFSVLALGCFGGWMGLSQLERKFYEGREIPPRNLPERSKSKK